MGRRHVPLDLRGVKRVNATGPVDPLVRAEPPFDWYRTPVVMPRRVETPGHLPDLDPDIALWPVTPLQRWPFTGAPAEGIWPKGWAGVDNTGTMYVCTVGGQPGTWAQVGSGGGGGWPTVNGTGSGNLTATLAVGDTTGYNLTDNGSGGINITDTGGAGVNLTSSAAGGITLLNSGTAATNIESSSSGAILVQSAGTGAIQVNAGSGGLALSQASTGAITIETTGGGATTGIALTTQATDTTGITLTDNSANGNGITLTATGRNTTGITLAMGAATNGGGIVLDQGGVGAIFLSTTGGLASAGIGLTTQATDTGGIVLMDNSTVGVQLQGNATGKLGMFNKAPVVQPTVAGALSTVADPSAKAVLTSIIAALSATAGLGAFVDGTT
jgi:hypothetical protein